jgi:ParB/RepB/Spo0J family partition protein
METKPKQEDTILKLHPDRIKSSYERLRIIYPKADAVVENSLKQYGQLLPIVVSPAKNDSYELLDGFKRFRGAKKLGFLNLKAKQVILSNQALKAAMIHLNRKVSTLSQLEEAMIVHSLSKDDALLQIEIAALLGRHKSWVSRRISMIDLLSPEVLDQIRLGLVGVSIGRELSRLPRGNQAAALETILKYHFTFKETSTLVSELLQRPRWEHANILRFPEPILSARNPPRPPVTQQIPVAEHLLNKLKKIDLDCRKLTDQFSPFCRMTPSQPEQQQLTDTIGSIKKHLGRLAGEDAPAF